jgi:hypothetical protein
VLQKAMSNIVVVHNFGKSVLLIIAAKPSVNLRDISVTQICMKEDNIYVEYEIKEQEFNKDYLFKI